MNITLNSLRTLPKHGIRWKCTSRKTFECKVLVVGGGTAGCNMVWRLHRKLKGKDIIVLEPSDVHFYQGGFTLVGAGIKHINQVHKATDCLLPASITRIADSAEEFEPSCNVVYTKNGNQIVYDFMVVAIGLKNDYDKIIGLKQALDDPRSTVSTIYSENYCSKTWQNIKQFKGGHAIFTSPALGGKCSAAVLKIMYLSDAYWRGNKIRERTSITYNSASSTIFHVPKYATALSTLALNRNMIVNYCTDLVEVTPTQALFKSSCGELISCPYNMLHVTPPMSIPECLSKCTQLVNDTGHLDVDKHTLQHKSFRNVFGLGDCISTPNSKTAAATGPQSFVVERNLLDAMTGKELKAKYNGYAACPILTSYQKALLAEFLYDNKICETFPFNQAKERRILYHITTKLIPKMYWRWLVKGKYNGPANTRNILNPLKFKKITVYIFTININTNNINMLIINTLFQGSVPKG